jgi:zinc protease
MQERQTARAQDSGLAGGLVSQLQTGRTMAFSADNDARLLALTREQVNAAIKKYVEPARFMHVYAGDFAGADKKAAAPAGGGTPVAGAAAK